MTVMNNDKLEYDSEEILTDKLKELYFRLTNQKDEFGMVQWEAQGIVNEIREAFKQAGYIKSEDQAAAPQPEKETK